VQLVQKALSFGLGSFQPLVQVRSLLKKLLPAYLRLPVDLMQQIGNQGVALSHPRAQYFALGAGIADLLLQRNLI